MEHQNKCRATGKVRFPDPGAAKEAIVRIKSTDRFYDHIQGKRVNRRAGKPGQCRYYYCKECHGWHLTSLEQSKSFRKYKKERKLETKDLLLNQEQAAEWKKNSIPFPDIKPNDIMKWYKLNDDKTTELIVDGAYPAETDFGTVKRVGDDTVDGQRVSTVFLHFDHNWGSNEAPVLFETMIFGGPYDSDMWRYSTWNEAKEGHDKIVHCLKHGINPNEAL